MDRYGNRPSDEARRYKFDRGMWLLGCKESLSGNSSLSVPVPSESSSVKPAVSSSLRLPDVNESEPDAKLFPPQVTAGSHNDVSVVISEGSDFVAAALEDLQSQDSKAKFLLPSLLCSAVSSGLRSLVVCCMVF